MAANSQIAKDGAAAERDNPAEQYADGRAKGLEASLPALRYKSRVIL